MYTGNLADYKIKEMCQYIAPIHERCSSNTQIGWGSKLVNNYKVSNV